MKGRHHHEESSPRPIKAVVTDHDHQKESVAVQCMKHIECWHVLLVLSLPLAVALTLHHEELTAEFRGIAARHHFDHFEPEPAAVFILQSWWDAQRRDKAAKLCQKLHPLRCYPYPAVYGKELNISQLMDEGIIANLDDQKTFLEKLIEPHRTAGNFLFDSDGRPGLGSVGLVMSYYTLFKNWTEGGMLPTSLTGPNRTLLILEDDAIFGEEVISHVRTALQILPPNFSILNLCPKEGFCKQLLTRLSIWDWWSPSIVEVTWSFSRTTGALYSWHAAREFVAGTPIYHTIDMNMRRLIRRGDWRGFVSCAHSLWADPGVPSVVDGLDGPRSRRRSRMIRL